MEDILKTFDNMYPFRRSPLPGSGRNNQLEGIQTKSGMFVWKTYTHASHSDPATIVYEHAVFQYLNQQALSFALPQPLPNREGQVLFKTAKGWAILRRYIPGDPLDPQNLKEVTAMGAMLGELHVALRHCPIGARPGRQLFQLFFAFPHPHYDPLRLVPADLGLPNSAHYQSLFAWWQEEAKLLQAFLDTQYPTLPWQLCHNDISPNNVMIVQNQVRGLLDFEFATPAPRAFDVAMALRMTMRVWENPEPWATIRAFFQGYRPWIVLSEQEVHALPMLIRLRSVMASLLRLGRQQDLAQIATPIQYCRNNVQWFERYGQQFLDYVKQEVALGN
ncbi:MAG: phosphotransferase [Anaerolineae bacterium]|nr:phosphotransferase [Anaerolineae bacterium]